MSCLAFSFISKSLELFVFLHGRERRVLVKAIICNKHHEDVLKIIKYCMSAMWFYHNYHYYKSYRVEKRVIMIIIILHWFPMVLPHGQDISFDPTQPCQPHPLLHSKCSSSTTVKLV